MTEHNCFEDTDAMQIGDFSCSPQQGCFATSLNFPGFTCVYEGKCPLKTHHGCCVYIKKGSGYRVYKHKNLYKKCITLL